MYPQLKTICQLIRTQFLGLSSPKSSIWSSFPKTNFLSNQTRKEQQPARQKDGGSWTNFLFAANSSFSSSSSLRIDCPHSAGQPEPEGANQAGGRTCALQERTRKRDLEFFPLEVAQAKGGGGGGGKGGGNGRVGR
jgi:hypothetical protein